MLWQLSTHGQVLTQRGPEEESGITPDRARYAAGTMAGLMEQQAMDGGRGGMRGHGACKGAVPTRAEVPM